MVLRATVKVQQQVVSMLGLGPGRDSLIGQNRGQLNAQNRIWLQRREMLVASFIRNPVQVKERCQKEHQQQLFLFPKGLILP